MQHLRVIIVGTVILTSSCNRGGLPNSQGDHRSRQADASADAATSFTHVNVPEAKVMFALPDLNVPEQTDLSAFKVEAALRKFLQSEFDYGSNNIAAIENGQRVSDCLDLFSKVLDAKSYGPRITLRAKREVTDCVQKSLDDAAAKSEGPKELDMTAKVVQSSLEFFADYECEAGNINPGSDGRLFRTFDYHALGCPDTSGVHIQSQAQSTSDMVLSLAGSSYRLKTTSRSLSMGPDEKGCTWKKSGDSTMELMNDCVSAKLVSSASSTQSTDPGAQWVNTTLNEVVYVQAKLLSGTKASGAKSDRATGAKHRIESGKAQLTINQWDGDVQFGQGTATWKLKHRVTGLETTGSSGVSP